MSAAVMPGVVRIIVAAASVAYHDDNRVHVTAAAEFLTHYHEVFLKNKIKIWTEN